MKDKDTQIRKLAEEILTEENLDQEVSNVLLSIISETEAEQDGTTTGTFETESRGIA